MKECKIESSYLSDLVERYNRFVVKKKERSTNEFKNSSYYLKHKRKYDSIEKYNLDLRRKDHLELIKKIESMPEREYQEYQHIALPEEFQKQVDIENEAAIRIAKNIKNKKRKDGPRKVRIINKFKN